MSKEVSIQRLGQIYLELKQKGAANINLVTPDHYVPQILTSLEWAAQHRLELPIVYNTSSYAKTSVIALLKDKINIYLADYKYTDAALAVRYSNAEDYPRAARAAIGEMVRQQPAPVFDACGMMQAGVIVRHLVLPGCVEDSKACIRYLYGTYGDQIYLSIMNQFTPCTNLEHYPELNRKVTEKEYEEVLDFAIKIGVSNAFVQEGETAEESFIPLFDYEGV